MTLTHACFSGTVTAAWTTLNKCVRVCGEFSNTFPQSLKARRHSSQRAKAAIEAQNPGEMENLGF